MAKKSKILFFARRFYPLIGGVEKHTLEVGKRLVSRGYEVKVLTENYQSMASSATIEGISIIRINAGNEGKLKKFRIWLQLFNHISVIRSSDIVHCHDVFFWYLPFRFLFPFKKVFTTFHGYEGDNIPTKKAIVMHKISEILSNGNICIGAFFKKWYGTNPTLVTYGAVDENEKISSKSLIKNKIIFFGRLEKETGVLEYLKVIKILKSRGKEYKLDVYGEGSLQNQAEKFSKENNLGIKFNRFIPNIENVLNNYEYVFCSRYLGILESMLFSKPIFAEYDNEIKKDYLEMTPFAKYISLNKNAGEIAQNIENYANNKLKLDLKKANEWTKAQTWNNMVNTYIKLWKI